MYDSILISDFISKDKLYKTELIECDTLWWRLADFVPYCLMLSLYCYTYRHLAAITHFIQVPCISRSRSPSIQERQSKFQNLLVWLCTITVTNPNPDTIFTLHHTEKNKSVFTYLCTLTTWYCRIRTPLLQQLIDISSLPGPQQQTCSSGFAVVGPCWDRQTDTETDGHHTMIDHVLHTLYSPHTLQPVPKIEAGLLASVSKK